MVSSPVTLKYDSENGFVEANTLVKSIASLVKVFQELNAEINKEYSMNQKLGINLKPVSENGFGLMLDISTRNSSVITQLYDEPVEYADSIADTFIKLVEVRKFLDGEKPASVGNVEKGYELTNQKGEAFIINPTVYRIFSENNDILMALKSNFESLNSDPYLKSFNISGNRGSKINITEKDFEIYFKKVKKIDKTHQIINLSQAKVFLRVIFERNIKLQFYYDGNRLNNVKFNDDSFQSDVENGKMIANGDQLIVEMDIYQEWDDTLKTFLNKSYEIHSVREHVHRNQELRLFNLD